jgi:hypothetical protein
LWACMALAGLCRCVNRRRLAAPLPAPAMACRVLIIKPGVDDSRVTMVMVDDARNVKKVVGLITCRADRLFQQHIDDSLRTTFACSLEDGGCRMWQARLP